MASLRIHGWSWCTVRSAALDISHLHPAVVTLLSFMFRKIKSKKAKTMLSQMFLTSVLWVWMCAFLYIQNSEAAIRGFLPKKNPTDVRKKQNVHKRSLNQHTDSLTKWQKFIRFNSLSLSLFISLCGKHSLRAATCTPAHRWHHNSGESKRTSLPCAASNKCDIFGRGDTESLALRFATATAAQEHLSDSVRRPAVVDVEWSVKKVWSIAPFTSAEARLDQTVF